LASSALALACLGKHADWRSRTALSSPATNKNVSTFSVGPGKYFRTARSNDLQMSSASADGEQFVFTSFLMPMVAMTQMGTSRRPSAGDPVRVYFGRE